MVLQKPKHIAILLFLAINPCLSFISTLPPHAQDMFNRSMSWMDSTYDSSASYIYDMNQGVQTAMHHNIRASAWYAIGLLARNNGSDVDEAMKIIADVIEGQFKDPKDQWYATYQQEAEEPNVGTYAYPAEIYGSWDPNWRGFIGTAFILALEEFGSLIAPNVTGLMLSSLYNNTIGDSYRIGGVDGDNLYPSYSNPSLMRAFVAGWTGRRLGVANFTEAGEKYAEDVVALFDRANTLSEFNSGTYAGVSMFALTLWSAYMPSSSVMGAQGPRILRQTWEAVGSLYHAGLKNSAGPWDRTYGYDMTRYMSILGLHIWGLVGREASPIAEKPWAMSHVGDFAVAPLLAVLAPFSNKLIPDEVVSHLSAFPGEHTVDTSAFSPPYDTWPRNITAWLSDIITIGAETFDEEELGGPSLSADSFSPAVVQWDTGDGVGWLKWYATEASLSAHASAKRLSLTYPRGNASSIFTFFVSTFSQRRDVAGWHNLPGLEVNVSGNVDMSGLEVSFNGNFGGLGKGNTINDFEFWNFTYSMPEGFTGTPELVLEIDVC